MSRRGFFAIESILFIVLALITALSFIFLIAFGIKMLLVFLIAGAVLLGFYTKAIPQKYSIHALAIMVGVFLIVTFSGSFSTLLNPKLTIEVKSNFTSDALAFDNFMCDSPIFRESGICRLAPGTYRSMSIKVCNNDIELPLPESILLAKVDPVTPLIPGQNIALSDLEISTAWHGSENEDIFLATGTENSMLEQFQNWMTGEQGLGNHPGQNWIMYNTPLLMPGECAEFGMHPDGEQSGALWLVANKHAKVNKEHTISIAMIEMREIDNTKSAWVIGGTIAGTITGGVVGTLIGGLPGTIIGSILGFIGSLYGSDQLTSYVQATELRSVYAVQNFNFTVASPDLTIWLMLGGIGILSILGVGIATKKIPIPFMK